MRTVVRGQFLAHPAESLVSDIQYVGPLTLFARNCFSGPKLSLRERGREGSIYGSSLKERQKGEDGRMRGGEEGRRVGCKEGRRGGGGVEGCKEEGG